MFCWSFLLIVSSSLLHHANGQYSTINSASSCPLTNRQLVQEDVMSDEWNTIKAGFDNFGDLYLGFSEKEGYREYWTGARRKRPILSPDVHGNLENISYTSPMWKSKSPHHILTNDHKCAIGWERVDREHGAKRVDTSWRHYPYVDTHMFIAFKVNQSDQIYVVVGSLMTFRKPPEAFYSWQEGRFKTSLRFQYEPENAYYLFYVDNLASVRKLVTPKLVSLTYDKTIVSKAMTTKVVYESDLIENKLSGPVERVFESGFKTAYTQITDTRSSNIGRVLKLEGELEFDAVKYRMDSTWTGKSITAVDELTSMTKETRDVISSRKEAIGAQMNAKMSATIDELKNVIVPYKAVYKIFSSSIELTVVQLQAMIEGVGGKQEFVVEDDQLYLHLSGQLVIDSQSNLRFNYTTNPIRN